MTHVILARSIRSTAGSSRSLNGKPGECAIHTIETGAVIARIFDLLEGTHLEPFAAQVAWGLINGDRCQAQR